MTNTLLLVETTKVYEFFLTVVGKSIQGVANLRNRTYIVLMPCKYIKQGYHVHHYWALQRRHNERDGLSNLRRLDFYSTLCSGVD